MKKITSLLLAISLCLSLCACAEKSVTQTTPSTETPTLASLETLEPTISPHDTAKNVYAEINTAYEQLHDFSDDLYEAWEISIFNEKEIRKDGFRYFSSKLSLSEEETLQGIARTVAASKSEDWDTLSADTKNHYLNNPDAYLTKVDHLISFCVYTVIYSYTANGTVETIQSALEDAKAQLKELDPDAPYYNFLKDYYMAVSSHLDFCLKPDGTYETLQTTSSNYENTVRNYRNELDFIFE